jgi:tRNA threonylcarbamoyladenosine biosynthesis protein TsaB
MMTLALDTSATLCAVAIHDSGADRIVSSVQTETQSGHAELLFGFIAEALRQAGIGYESLSRVAAVRGPGSFTGIRIALSSARGLALAMGMPAVGVDAFAAHRAGAARIVGGAAPILVALDARRDEIYARLFSGSGNASEPVLGTPDGVLARCEGQLKAGLRVCGSAADRFADRFGPPVHCLPAPPIDEVVRLGAEADPGLQPPVPLYIRPPDAKPASARAFTPVESAGSPGEIR